MKSEQKTWKVLPSCYLKMTVFQLKVQTKQINIEQAAETIIERVKQVQRQGGYDQLNHVFQLRKKKIFLLHNHIIQQIQLMGAIIWLRTIEGKTLLKISDGTGIIDCVYWHKLGNYKDEKKESQLQIGTCILIMGRPDVYKQLVQVYVTKYFVVDDFYQQLMFQQQTIQGYDYIFGDKSPENNLQSDDEFQLFQDQINSPINLPQKKRKYLSYIKIRQALVNSYIRSNKLQVQQIVTYPEIRQEIIEEAKMLKFEQYIEKNSRLLTEIIEDLEETRLIQKIPLQKGENMQKFEVLNFDDFIENILKQILFFSKQVQAQLNILDKKLTFKQIIDHLSANFNIMCLSKQTIYLYMDRLYKQGIVIQQKLQKAQNSAYKLPVYSLIQ